MSRRGAVVSKCFLGAMKPGVVAPAFVARDEGDALYLLTNPDGAPLDPAAFAC